MLGDLDEILFKAVELFGGYVEHHGDVIDLDSVILDGGDVGRHGIS